MSRLRMFGVRTMCGAIKPPGDDLAARGARLREQEPACRDPQLASYRPVLSRSVRLDQLIDGNSPWAPGVAQNAGNWRHHGLSECVDGDILIQHPGNGVRAPRE